MTDIDADGGGSVNGAWDRVRIICKRKIYVEETVTERIRVLF